ncbi:NAD(P)-dependent alcohol dehydrogenase [Streptomyces armeniacus]|uniref:NAD(P)-dependent alcohol dehydrogenase n=1 Tax=Streptomyces armeniacus TaxID=83291 RepID=A0A345XQX7_9ACTN|nr:NAD(P)-dependent alcohol dehydrogenase [Streptomyces armeniacus]AXK34043.1 NAD(P)-dependent alcohol dehydrogenase [Streptomyces armeniacus]
MKVTAAVATAPKAPLELRELELADPAPDEVRVRLAATGVCHTDALVRDQVYPTPLPAVLGHEGAGVVEETGADVRGVRPGDHVVLSFNSCGACDNCAEGAPSYCRTLFELNFGGRRPDGTTPLLDGGEPVSAPFFGQSSFSERANVAARSLVRVDPDLPLDVLAPLGCGVLTGAGAVFNTLRPPAGSSLAVFGTGAVGASALLAALASGCTTVIAVDVLEPRLELARTLGATHTVNAAAEDPVARVQELTAGRGVDYALEATGLPGVLRQAADALALRGTVGVVGASAPGTETSFETGMSLTKGWTLRTIVEGDAVPHLFVPRLIELWQQGRFPFDKLITAYPFARINEAFHDSATGAAVKPVLTFG